MTKKLRQKGLVVCNGGFSSKPGLMCAIMTGALSADDGEKKLPPLVVIVTEDLFRKDNLGGRYPEGNIRILLLEDSRHRPDTMIRAHILNSIPDFIASFWGGVGTFVEIFHYMEQCGLNPDQYRKPLLILNLDKYFDGILMQLRQALRHGAMNPIPNIAFYTAHPQKPADSDIRNQKIVNDIVATIRRAMEGISLQEQHRHPQLKGGKITTLSAIADRLKPG